MNFEKLSLLFMFICIIVLFTQNYKLHNQIENINNTVEHVDNTDSKQYLTKDEVKALILHEYNYDMEAIRNLGSISKSLITGKNYHNTDISGADNIGKLIIPANVEILGDVTIKKSLTTDNSIVSKRNITSEGNLTSVGLKTNNISTKSGDDINVSNRIVSTRDGIFGKAVIGSSNNYAVFAHKDNDDGNYKSAAVAQKSDGNTVIGSAENKMIELVVNWETIQKIKKDEIEFKKNLDIAGGVEASGDIRATGNLKTNKEVQLLTDEDYKGGIWKEEDKVYLRSEDGSVTIEVGDHKKDDGWTWE